MVFDDGTIYVFFRDTKASAGDGQSQKTPSKPIRIPIGLGRNDNANTAFMQVNQKNYNPSDGPEYKEYSREQIVRFLQEPFEKFDFDSFYSKEQRQSNQAIPCDTLLDDETEIKLISEKYEEFKECVLVSSKIFTHRAFNYVVGHFKHQPEEINPYMILKFDVKEINDITTFRVGALKKEHWIVTACNDGYVRVFSLKNLQLQRVIKGVGGNPLCIDVAKTSGSMQ